MSPFDEVRLLSGARALDLESLAEVYDRFSPGLYKYAARLLGDPDLAEDCVSETFTRLLKVLRQGFGPQDHLRAYLYRTAHNWITDRYRHQPLPFLELDADLHADPAPSPESQAEERLENLQTRAALAALTPDQRQVVVLRFIEGWDTEEVAVALQKPTGAIKALQHRALGAMRRWLKKHSLNPTITGER
jgi:RNA polymerase sigma-70 factor (ECF subfamily)